MKTINFTGEQGGDEWRKLRLGCVTGSGFAFVMAKGKGNEEAVTRRNYRVRLALELLTGVPEENSFTTRDIQLGIEREPAARLAFETSTGHLIEQVSFVRVDGERIGCSPDGLIGADDGFEVKSPSKAVHFNYLSLTAKPPSEYIPQVQGCMWVTGRKYWHFASYNPDFPIELQLHHFSVERDETYIEQLAQSVRQFNKEVDQTMQEMLDMIAARS
jgi:YqaJ-like viral recombinase domain